MNKVLVWSLLIILPTIMMPLAIQDVSIESISSGNLQQERQLFVQHWKAEWKDYSLAQLQISNVTQFLHQLFDQEEQDYFKHDPNHVFYRAVLEDRLVGFISFDIDHEKNLAYVRQIALSSDLYTEEGVQKLLFSIVDDIPEISGIDIVFRDEAHAFIKLLENIGFEQTSDMREGCDPELYSYYKLLCSSRCGTCYCGCDEDDLAFEMMAYNGGEADAALDMEMELACGCDAPEDEIE